MSIHLTHSDLLKQDDVDAIFAALPAVEVRLFEPGEAPSAKTMEVRTTRPKMTLGRAAIIKSIDTYRDLNYGLTKIEVQKLGYFLQAAGQDLGLRFEQHLYGLYSEQLRHALNRMEGHFIVDLGDGSVDSEIEPALDALSEADAFLGASDDPESAFNAVGMWNARKKKLMQPVHVRTAWDRLKAEAWIA